MNIFMIYIRDDHFQFGSVFIKQNNQTKNLKKNRNQFKPTDFGSVRLGFLGQKPVQTGLARFFWFFPVCLSFFGFGLVFPGFFCFEFGLVFSVSGLWNRTDRFFQNFNRFFSRFGFFDYFFPDFLGLIGFLVFLLTHIYIYI